MKFRDLILLIVINALWGFNFIAGKAGTEIFGPIFFSALRFIVVLVLLLPFARWHPGQMKLILLIGVLMGLVHYPIMFTAIHLTENVSVIAIAAQLLVPFSTILAVIFLAERVGLTRTVAIVLSFAGVVVISYEPFGADHILSLVLTTVAALSIAAATILMRKLSVAGVFNLQFWIAAVSTVSLLVLSVLIESPSVALLKNTPLTDYWSPIYSGIGATIIGHGSFYYLLTKYEVSDVAPFITLSSIFAIAFGILLLGDVITTRVVIGGVLTLIGVTIVAQRSARSTEVKQPERT